MNLINIHSLRVIHTTPAKPLPELDTDPRVLNVLLGHHEQINTDLPVSMWTIRRATDPHTPHVPTFGASGRVFWLGSSNTGTALSHDQAYLRLEMIRKTYEVAKPSLVITVEDPLAEQPSQELAVLQELVARQRPYLWVHGGTTTSTLQDHVHYRGVGPGRSWNLTLAQIRVAD